MEFAASIEPAVIQDKKRADRMLGSMLRGYREAGAREHLFASQAIFALFRWRGWIEPLYPESLTARLLFSSLMDLKTVDPVCRVWARQMGIPPASLLALGDAPSWPARVSGLRRMASGRRITGDPWRLAPEWLRGHLVMPPGDGAPRLRLAEFLRILQTPAPLWVRAQGSQSKEVWDELRKAGLKPWVHRGMSGAARLDEDVDVYHLPAYRRGALEIQDLAAQAVGCACDPEPGERWWDACCGGGGKALHLADLMRGKGVVVASDLHTGRLQEAARRARRGGFSNISTREWDGKHPPGKGGSFHGVLVDAPCSAVGTWRRNPDARWVLDEGAFTRLAEVQSGLLKSADAGLRVGGALVYSVCTVSTEETEEVIHSFLETHGNYQLDPFPNPLTGQATNGMLRVWPGDADSDAMFIARMIRKS